MGCAGRMGFGAALSALLLLAVVSAPATAAEHRLFSFNASNGLNPQTALALGNDGTIYGTAVSGGNAGGFGTVYALTTLGSVSAVYAFPQADSSGTGNSTSRLVQGVDGNLYGTSQAGGSGNGTVFKLSPSGAFTVIYTFSGAADGKSPGELIFGSDGNLYGTTASGGAGGFGTAFKISTAGALTTLHSFAGASDAANPSGALAQGNDGSFYGVAAGGGGSTAGVVYKMTTGGAVTVLHAFSGGTTLRGGLVMDAAGNFYGTTADPSQTATGSVFSITPAGVVTTLHTFTGADGYGSGAPPVARPASARYSGSARTAAPSPRCTASAAPATPSKACCRAATAISTAPRRVSRVVPRAPCRAILALCSGSPMPGRSRR
jgi:uncharacterized repeat protein (TIGR03803 family)